EAEAQHMVAGEPLLRMPAFTVVPHEAAAVGRGPQNRAAAVPRREQSGHLGFRWAAAGGKCSPAAAQPAREPAAGPDPEDRPLVGLESEERSDPFVGQAG